MEITCEGVDDAEALLQKVKAAQYVRDNRRGMSGEMEEGEATLAPSPDLAEKSSDDKVQKIQFVTYVMSQGQLSEDLLNNWRLHQERRKMFL